MEGNAQGQYLKCGSGSTVRRLPALRTGNRRTQEISLFALQPSEAVAAQTGEKTCAGLARIDGLEYDLEPYQVAWLLA